MMSGAGNLAMYALAKEIFHVAEDERGVIDGVQLDSCKAIRKASGKTLDFRSAALRWLLHRLEGDLLSINHRHTTPRPWCR